MDFVILWVNGSDKNWLYKKNKYLAKYNNCYHGGSSSERYRDYDT
ncbi:Stealth CR1 domain-containing protein, partial [Lactobacillus gallinarum]|nr:Stealth CR1 domain-containing protein [Lactobacillus gallinarum]